MILDQSLKVSSRAMSVDSTDAFRFDAQLHLQLGGNVDNRGRGAFFDAPCAASADEARRSDSSGPQRAICDMKSRRVRKRHPELFPLWLRCLSPESFSTKLKSRRKREGTHIRFTYSSETVLVPAGRRVHEYMKATSRHRLGLGVGGAIVLFLWYSPVDQDQR